MVWLHQEQRRPLTSREIWSSSGEETYEILDFSPIQGPISPSILLLCTFLCVLEGTGASGSINLHPAFPSLPNSYSPIRSIDSHMMALFSKNLHIPPPAYRTWTSSSTTTIANLCVYCSVDLCRTHDADTAFHWPLSAKTRTVNEIKTKRNEEDQNEHLRSLSIVVWRSRRRLDLCNLFAFFSRASLNLLDEVLCYASCEHTLRCNGKKIRWILQAYRSLTTAGRALAFQVNFLQPDDQPPCCVSFA